MATTYKKGQTVVCEFTFRNTAGAVVDPASAALMVRKPDKTTATYTLADALRVSEGVYTLNVVGNQAGRWYYRGDGDNGESVDETHFIVEESVFV